MRNRPQPADDRRFDEQLDRALSGAAGTAGQDADEGGLAVARALATALAPLRAAPPLVQERAWRTVQARVAAAPAASPARRRIPRLLSARPWSWRLGAVACALLLLLMAAGGGAYATSRLLTPVMPLNDPAGAGVVGGNLARPLDLMQTVDGVTITLERAYADANRVVLAYSLQAADPRGTTGGWDALAHMALSDTAGRAYPMLRGQEDRRQPLGPPTQPLVALVSFDASALPPDAGTVTFHLSISHVGAYRPGMPAEKRPIPDPLLVQVPGPWAFTFALPVAPARIAQVQKTATAGGVGLTLERVVATPSETRVYLRLPSRPGEAIDARRDALRLVVGGTVWRAGEDPDHLDYGRRTAEGLYAYSFPGSLDDRGGGWTLTVQALRSGVDGKGGVWDWHQSGPWVFRFAVPQSPVPPRH